jgi:1-acyl-sn-glycerol-3-phosphate acyltransferase
MLYYFSKFIGFILFKLFFNIRFFGQKNMPDKGPVVIASNHLSFLDPVVLGVAASRRLNFMAKEELFTANKLFARLIAAVGAFPIKKGNLKDISAVKEAINRLNEGKALVIFPEGSRSSTGKLQDARAGLGLIASKVNCPIIPTRIKGTDKALPLEARFIRFFKPVSVHFGKIILPESGKGKDVYRSVADKVMDEIAKLG